MLKFRTHSTLQDSEEQESNGAAWMQEALRSAPPSMSSVLQPPAPTLQEFSARVLHAGHSLVPPSPRPPHSFIPDHFTLLPSAHSICSPTGPQSHCHLPHCPP